MTQRFALVSAVLLCLAGVAHADGWSFSTQMMSDKDIITCSDIEMSYWEDHKGDLVTARRDQTISVRAPGSGPLRVIAPRQGGVWVQPSTDGTMSAVLCEAAGARSESAAHSTLDKVQIMNQGGELHFTGPDEDHWSGYIILSVPKDVSLDMTAEDGALDVRGVQGTFVMRSSNGPISIAHVRGKVDAQASNGPIGFEGHEGDVNLRADNGPLKVRLDAPSWSGTGLEGSSQNGPIKVIVPDDLQTGVRIAGSWHSPWKWKGYTIGSADDEGGRSVTLGKGPVLVRVSTVNGPVDVKGPGDKSGRSKI
jgi:hypothetical protein